MPAWTEPATIVISCARGLAPYTVLELQRLGYTVDESGETSLSVRGSLTDAMRLNLWLRTAHRVLWPVAMARARTLDDLYTAVAGVPWEHWLDPDGYFTVGTAVWNPDVRDTRMPALKTKDAIADRLRRVCGRRPDSGGDFGGAAVFIYWHENDLRVYLDTTGEPLSRRGYRLHPWVAPMQETLAAACILATDWNAATPLVVPMCGSGTPAIEAALIARNRAPGTFRKHFAFMSLKDYTASQDVWHTLVAEAKQGERTEGLPVIVATDIAPQAVDTARTNARAAGVAASILFNTCDFADTHIPPPPGVLFMNPEYGERLGSVAELEPVYERIGRFLRERCGGYRAFILAGNKKLSLRMGLKSTRRLPFMNGPIDCRLLEFEVYGPATVPPRS
jgi:23S rRNA G2445 N2-methylase RlmL